MTKDMSERGALKMTLSEIAKNLRNIDDTLTPGAWTTFDRLRDLDGETQIHSSRQSDGYEIVASVRHLEVATALAELRNLLPPLIEILEGATKPNEDAK